MDQTELFKATVRTLKLRRKKDGAPVPSSSSSPSSKSGYSEFSRQARDVVTFIGRLQSFLVKHRKNYIDSARHLLGGGSAMSDAERDAIDSEAQAFIEDSQKRIHSLQVTFGKDTRDGSMTSQVSDYRLCVLHSLQYYLKNVAELYSEQRAIRVKRIVDRKRTSRLMPEKYRRLMNSVGGGAGGVGSRWSHDSFNSTSSLTTIDSEPSASSNSTSLQTREDNGNVSGDVEVNGDSSERDRGGNNYRDKDTTSSSLRNRRKRRREGESDSGIVSGGSSASLQQPSPSINSNLTVEEEAEFARENEQLLEHVTTMVDEVRQIEDRVIEISKLQQVFSQKVLQQAEQLDIITKATTDSVHNVLEGNEQIKGAMKNKASLRVWILFILILLSFAILFLDWYS